MLTTIDAHKLVSYITLFPSSECKQSCSGILDELVIYLAHGIISEQTSMETGYTQSSFWSVVATDYPYTTLDNYLYSIIGMYWSLLSKRWSVQAVPTVWTNQVRPTRRYNCSRSLIMLFCVTQFWRKGSTGKERWNGNVVVLKNLCID